MARKILDGSIPNVKNDDCNITPSISHKKLQKNWILIDAENLVVGRLCAAIAKILKGKHKADYTPHVDCGDYVIVLNADKVKFTGRKEKQQIYYHHTGYPGGLKERTAQFVRSTKPEDIIMLGVKRMLSKGPLRNKIMTHLLVYKGTEHNHVAQNPQKLDFASLNRKNKVI